MSAEIVFLSDDHTNISTNVTTDTKSLQPGNDVDVVIGNLEENTEYRMAVAVYNYGGRGATSQFITSRTCESIEIGEGITDEPMAICFFYAGCP